MKLLYSYLRRYKWLLILALFLAAVNQVFSLLDPLIFQHMLDRYIVTENAIVFKNLTPDQFIKGILTFIAMMIGVAMVSRIAKNFQDYFVNVVVQKLGSDIYTDGLKHSLELPYQAFEDQRSGETLGKLQKVRSDVEKLIQAFVNILFATLIGVVFVTVYAFNKHWMIPLVYFSAIPLLGMLSSFLSRRIKGMQKIIVGETTALAGATTETLRNIELIKSLGLKNQETERLNNVTGKILGLELKKVRYIRSLSFVQGTVVNFLRNCILFLLLFLIFREQLTVGELFALQIYSFFIFGPLQEIGNFFNVYREAEVSLANFQAILEAPKEKIPVNPVSIGNISSLEFSNVSFSHLSSKSKAVNNISFFVKTGETIALVGPSGSGKTTLVKLLVGLYHPSEGRILYNNSNAEVVNMDELRSQIGFVTQDTQLFAGTIRENLLFVAPAATDEECYDALKRAACQTLMDRANNGLDTVIGEGGVKVSGGEKQRLSIARALLRKPRMLIFDEATSALDSITENEITSTIRNISHQGGHLTVLIAHRLSTIMHADKIYVLEKGNIVEQGSHTSLLNEKGLYFAMWRQQIGERETVLN